MYIVFFLLFLGIVVTLAVIFFLSGRRKPVQAPPRPIADKVSRSSSADGAAEPMRQYNTLEQRAALIAAYPAVKEVAYRSIPEGVFPSILRDTDIDVRKAIETKISFIKLIPESSLKLLNLLRNPESEPGEISSIVKTNPVFSAKILQAVNTAYFSFPEKIVSIGRAITLLGYNNVRSLVFQDALNETIPRTSVASESYIQNWVHSGVVSVCAGYLGKQVLPGPGYDLATIGLLHDIGKYFIQKLEEGQMAAVDLPAVLREEQEHGINHAVLGALITTQWQLSESVAESIEYHHHPAFLPPEALPASCLKQSFVICLSDLISKVLGYAGLDSELLPIKDEYYDRFHLNHDLSTIITPPLLKEIEKTRAAIESYANVTLHG
jgi:putative nucleotidyltransferase with HDIG domain